MGENKQGFVCTPVKPNCGCSAVFTSMVYRRTEGRSEIFPAKRFVNRAFQNEGEGGVRPSLRGG